MRLWHRFRAFIGGYFWLPCPVCRRYFGGHEWNDRCGELIISESTSQVTCPNCPGRYIWRDGDIMELPPADVVFQHGKIEYIADFKTEADR